MLAPLEHRILGNGALGWQETEGGDPGDLRSYVGTVFTWVDKLGLRGLLACQSVELGSWPAQNDRGLGVCLAQHGHSVNKSPFLEQKRGAVGGLELAAGASPEPGAFDSPMDPSCLSLHFLPQACLLCLLVPSSMTRKAKKKSHSAVSGASVLLDA